MDSQLEQMMSEKLGGSKGKKAKKAKLHMHIHQMDDGKFHAEHEYRGGDEMTKRPDSSEHAPANIKDLIDHIKEHFSDAEPEASAANSPAPQAAPMPAQSA